MSIKFRSTVYLGGVKLDPGLTLDQGGSYLHDDGLNGVCRTPALRDDL